MKLMLIFKLIGQKLYCQKYKYSGNFSLLAPSRSLLPASIKISLKSLCKLYFNEILLGATFTGQVGAVKTKFPA